MPNNFPDWSGTWTDVKGFTGKTPWFTENWSALVDRTEDIAQVIDTATAGYTTLNDRLDDFTTVADVNAIVGGGGTPSNIPITSLGVGTLSNGETAKKSETGSTLVRNQRTYGSRYRNGQYSIATTATGVVTLYLQNITTTTSTSLGLTYLSTPSVYVFNTTISGIYLISIEFSIQYYHDSQSTNYITATTYLKPSQGETTKNLIKWNGVALPIAIGSQTQNVSSSLICRNIDSDAPSMYFGAYIQVDVGIYAGTKYIIIEDLKFQVIKVN
jgi:hypothetical protein